MFVLSPLREFSFIFRCKVCSAAGENFKKFEILPNDRMKLEITKRRHLEHSAVRRDWY